MLDNVITYLTPGNLVEVSCDPHSVSLFRLDAGDIVLTNGTVLLVISVDSEITRFLFDGRIITLRTCLTNLRITHERLKILN